MEKNKEKRNGIGKIISGAIISFVGVGLLCTAIAAFIAPTPLNLLMALQKGFTGGFFGVDLLASFLVSITILYQNMMKEHQRNWDSLINSRDLVLHPEINYFESKHLDAAERILFPADDAGPKKRILALDSTPPAEWWANNMLGYLALQSRWAMQSSDRRVSRVFVWSSCQFNSIPGKKIIQLHRLFGFDTYIVSQQVWNKIVKSIGKKKNLDYECVVWDKNDAAPSHVEVMTPHNTFGYRSYWKLRDGEIERERVIERLKDKHINILFCPLGQQEAAEYRTFLNLLFDAKHVTKIENISIDGIASEIATHAAKYEG